MDYLVGMRESVRKNVERTRVRK